MVRLLTRAGRVLGSSLTLDQTLRHLLDLLVPELGDACVLHLLGRADTVEVELVRAIPTAEPAFEELARRFPPAAQPNSPLAIAMRAGRPQRVDEVTDAVLEQFASDPEQRELLGRLEIRSMIAAPIRTPDRVWGALGVFLLDAGDPQRRFSATEQALIEEIADRAGLAVSHARLFREAVEARRDAEYAAELTARLQQVTAALAAADSPDAVYDVIIGALVGMLGAIGGGVLEASPDGDALYPRRVTGYPPETVAAYSTVPLRAVLEAGPASRGWLPVHDAWTTGQPVWVRNLEEWLARYRCRPTLLGPGDDASWGVLPLVTGGALTGALTVTWPDPRDFTDQERGFGTALASHCGQALERARLRASEAAALRAAARAEQQLTTAMAQVADPIVTLDTEARFMFINPAASARIRRFGIEPGELLGQVAWDVVPQLRNSPLHEAVARAQAEHLPIHFEEYYAELAAWYAVDLSASAYGVTIVARDVTSVRALQESEQRLRGLAAVVQSSRDAIVSKTLDGTIKSWNPSAERIFGYSSAEMVGDSIFKLIPESLHEEERQMLRRVSQGEVVESFEAERIRKDGRRITIAITLSPVHDAAGQVTGVSSIKRDVTEQRAIQRALQESESRLQAVLQQLPSGVIMAEAPSGRLILASRQVEIIWRRPTVFADDVTGYAAYQGFHGDGRPYAPEEWPLARAMNGETVLGEEIRILRGDGTTGWISVNAAPLRDDLGTIVGSIVAFSDMTAEHEAEERLRQSAKMDAIGRLAGGLAHDFNNQLSAVSGFAQFVERDPGLGARARQDLLQVQLAAERMASLTRQLLTFSRQQILMPETIDVNAAVADAHPLLQRLIGTQIQMRIETPATPVWVRADRSQLLQVLMNLAINARDAMPHGGTLDIRSRMRRVDATDQLPTEGAALTPGLYAEIVVEDSGTGIAPDVLPKIFEPFFTTKELGRGTGLGLATVHGIVSQSRGAVWAESAPGHGATFHVLLPLATPPEPAPPSAMDAAPEGSQHGRVLVVEDEDHVRQLVARVLTEAGFDVVHARHGGEALQRLAEIEGAVDIVVSDIVMPVMGGRELASQLKQRYPSVPVIWMSGYPSEALTFERVLPEDAPFLQKPTAPDVLVETVRRMLSTKPAGPRRP
ncbi:MAG TPA: PAS domain S-box protein [Gemmatimonadales bacterium]|nr:PAS domain S-box protein [Gemmatimonadales bacterium]